MNFTNPDFRLETERLIIRNWKESDRDLFYFINSDDTVMKFFPFRRDRKQSDELMDKLKGIITASGTGFTALEEKATGKPAGFCGLSVVNMPEIFTEKTIEIGWRLAPQFWGRGYATESAIRLLQFGFEDMGYDEIVSFAVHDNFPSLRVMQRIGMKRDGDRDFDLPGMDTGHSRLARHVFYSASRKDWQEKGR